VHVHESTYTRVHTTYVGSVQLIKRRPFHRVFMPIVCRRRDYPLLAYLPSRGTPSINDATHSPQPYMLLPMMLLLPRMWTLKQTNQQVQNATEWKRVFGSRRNYRYINEERCSRVCFDQTSQTRRLSRSTVSSVFGSLSLRIHSGLAGNNVTPFCSVNAETYRRSGLFLDMAYSRCCTSVNPSRFEQKRVN